MHAEWDAETQTMNLFGIEGEDAGRIKYALGFVSRQLSQKEFEELAKRLDKAYGEAK